MALTFDEYRCKLINKILFAQSQDEVRRFIVAAMKSLQEHRVNGYIIARFVEKTIQLLESFSPSDRYSQQSVNITTARILFNRIRQQTITLPHRLNRFRSGLNDTYEKLDT